MWIAVLARCEEIKCARSISKVFVRVQESGAQNTNGSSGSANVAQDPGTARTRADASMPDDASNARHALVKAKVGWEQVSQSRPDIYLLILRYRGSDMLQSSLTKRPPVQAYG